MALAVGAIVAGCVSIPPALGGSAVLEHFLAPSCTGQTVETHVIEGGAPSAAEATATH